MAEDEAEYESDPEEANLSLKMRRKEASDDEEEGDDGEERGKGRKENSSRGGIDSDGESDGQGGVAEYEDEGLEEDEEYYEEEEEEEEERVGESAVRDGEAAALGGEEGDESLGEVVMDKEVDIDERVAVFDQTEEEKKENEPFAVPTAGTFYMHDDRFQDNAGGRHRRTFGGRKLWESKDDRKWGHDKFEEMNTRARSFEEGRRSSRGSYRGRGRGRGIDHVFARGNRQRGYDGNDNQTLMARTVRGRGPRRYQPLKSKNEAPVGQTKQSAKSHDKSSYAASGRNSVPTANKVSEQIPFIKVASSLNSASPPFYPSGSSNMEISPTHRREAQAGIANRNTQPTSLAEDEFPMQQPVAFLRGKEVDFVGMDKLYIDNSASSASSKQKNDVQFSPASSVCANQAPQSRAHSRSLLISGVTTLQSSPTYSHANKLSSVPQVHATLKNPVKSQNHPSSLNSSQQLSQHPVAVSHGSPPNLTLSTSSVDTVELDSGPESNKSKMALVGKGKGTVQGDGKGPFLYGGGQLMASSGNVGAAHGDQNFPATPAFLSVMQFGGQHPGGIGVPAVGMAFPGYVANPQLGLGNSEMTWLPVLAGAAGALGTTYPYITVDGAYHARPTAHTPALAASSKENGALPSNDWKPQQRSEITNDELSQRPNKPRRYSEMKFDQ
ncbi:hypothetical protein Dimus_004347 [Dionaea muscipula]